MCAFPVYTAQILGCFARNCLMRALVCMHFPGLILATQVQVLGYFIKAQIWLGLRFAPIPSPSSSGDQVLGAHSRPQLKAATYPLPCPSCSVFWVYNGHVFSGVLCLFWEADLWLRPSRRMLTIQNPKKSWLATKSAWSLV